MPKFLTGTKLGGTNKKGPGLTLKGDAKNSAFGGGKKVTKAPKKKV